VHYITPTHRGVRTGAYGGLAAVVAFAHGVLPEGPSPSRPTDIVVVTALSHEGELRTERFREDAAAGGGGEGEPETVYLLRWYYQYYRLLPSSRSRRHAPMPLSPLPPSLPVDMRRRPRSDDEEEVVGGRQRKQQRLRADPYAGANPQDFTSIVAATERLSARLPEAPTKVTTERERRLFDMVAGRFGEDYGKMASLWNAVVGQVGGRGGSNGCVAGSVMGGCDGCVAS
jgi:hypothetical protein